MNDSRAEDHLAAIEVLSVEMSNGDVDGRVAERSAVGRDRPDN